MFELRLLGALDISASDGRNVEHLVRQSRRTGLLAYLAAALPRGFHRRDKLLALFWPESDEPHARAALSQALYVLRNTLGEQAVVTRGEVEVGLSAGVVWCDVAAFEAALDGERPVEALALYRGDLLEGFFVTGAPEFERWLDAERARLRQRASDGAWALAEARAAAGVAVEAERWARRAGELLPDDEAVIRRLMTFLHRLGDKAAAIRAYEAFAWRLGQEHELEPSAETQALAAAIRGDERRSVTPRSAALVATSPSPSPAARRKVPGWLTAATVAALVALGTLVAPAVRSWRRAPARDASPVAYERTSIAVLPFQNLSAEGPHAYFAGGLHDEILTQLSKVADLKVISRTSVMAYARPNTPPLRRIATELGVGSVVEGTVQVVSGRLRVNVQLIDAVTDRHLWSEQYNRTLEDAFAIQSDVAQRIVTALGAALTSTERHTFAEMQTAQAEAYLFYLQAREYQRRPGLLRRNFESAQQLYERALALDPDFALAHAALARVHGFMYWLRYDMTPARMAREREEAEAALRLAPDLPQAHVAMGHVQARQADSRAALEEYHIALRGLPNDADAWRWVAQSHRRLGEWEQFAVAFEKAVELDPRNADLLSDQGGGTHRRMGRYADAVRWYDRALSIAPDLHVAQIAKGWVYVSWKGQLDTLRAVLSALPAEAELPEGASRTLHHARLLLFGRQTDSLLQLLTVTRIPVLQTVTEFEPTSLWAAWAHQLRGDRLAARTAFDSALVFLDSAILKFPDDWPVHLARGMALAGLGRRDEALREVRWLLECPIYRRDVYLRPSVVVGAAQILARAGEADAALDQLEKQLAERPSGLSVHFLRLDPRWDPIRDHPRFTTLLAKYERPVT